MKNLFFSFVAVVVAFFASMSASAFEIAVTPAPGQVESIGSLSFVNAEDGGPICLNYDYSKAVTLSLEGEGVVRTFDCNAFDVISTGNYPNWTPVEWYVYNFGESVTKPGSYTLTVPAGFFGDCNGSSNSEVEYHYTIAAGTALDVTPTPGEVESLKDFRISNAAGLVLAEGCKVRLLDMLGATVVEFAGSDMEADWGAHQSLPDAWTFSIDETFVAPGTYTLVAAEGAFLIGENQLPSEALNVEYTIPGEPVVNDIALAQKLAASYTATQHGESCNNDSYELLPYERSYKAEISADGEYIYITNLCDFGSQFFIYGVVNGASRKVYFSQQSLFLGWNRVIVKGAEDASFTATISDDFQTLTFDDFNIMFGEDLYESVKSLVLTRMPDPVVEWTVSGTTHWTTDAGNTSAYVADNANITLTKFVQGEDVHYELTCFGGTYDYPTLVKFNVNEDGTLNFLNPTYSTMFYDCVNYYDDSVAVYPYDEEGNPASGIEGDANGGKLSVRYEYYAQYWNSVPDENGSITFKWGDYNVPEIEFTTDPEDGSVVKSFNRIVYTFTNATVADCNFNGYKVTIVDEEGNVASDNVGLAWGAGLNQLAVNCNTVSKPGTYTITIRKGSVILDGKKVDQDIVITLTIAAAWDGTVVLPESVTTVDDLLNLPVDFLYAGDVEVSGFGVLGAVFDTDGDVYALLFTDGVNDFAGSVDTEGEVANVHFAKMSDLKASIGSAADAYAQRIGGFVQPEIGKATLYICPKSFVVDGKVYAESICKTYTVAGSGQATGIDGITTDSEATYYDFLGRRTVAPAKGLVIKNGVKVVK